MIEFKAFPKIPRYSREVIVTEKIDGTNASLYIGEDGEFLTGSRSRWITPDEDNYGFSRWANHNKEALLTLGPGLHFGEWWGSGIQRGYGLKGGDKRLSLFNVQRFALHGQEPQVLPMLDPAFTKKQIVLPPCVGLVPVLWRGCFDDLRLDTILTQLKENGSIAAPGFMRPEGVVVFHTAGMTGFKKTLEKDNEPKSKGTP